MRVLLCTLPQKTHFLTMAPLMWALRTAGHEVRVACLPGFADVVTQAGLTAVPVGTDQLPDDPEDREAIRRGLPPPYDVVERPGRPARWTAEARDAYRMMVTYAFDQDNAPMIPDLVAFARQWQPDLVLWEPFSYAGAIAAKACGAAHARLLFTLDVLGLTHEWIHGVNRSLPPERREDPLVDWLTAMAAQYGFDFSEDLVFGQFTIDQLPASLRGSGALHYVSLRYVPYGGPAVVPPWLWAKSAAPRVAITLGLSATEHFDGYTLSLNDLCDSLADLPIEIVATVSARERPKLGPVPDNVRVVDYVPLHALAPTCAAVIHHGGFGTLSTVALHGVPQLALPFHFEGPLLSRKLADQGAGLSIHSDLATGDVVRKSLLLLLEDPCFRDAATRLRDEITAMPSPNELAARLEQLAADHRPAR